MSTVNSYTTAAAPSGTDVPQPLASKAVDRSKFSSFAQSDKLSLADQLNLTRWGREAELTSTQVNQDIHLLKKQSSANEIGGVHKAEKTQSLQSLAPLLRDTLNNIVRYRVGPSFDPTKEETVLDSVGAYLPNDPADKTGRSGSAYYQLTLKDNGQVQLQLRNEIWSGEFLTIKWKEIKDPDSALVARLKTEVVKLNDEAKQLIQQEKKG